MLKEPVPFHPAAKRNILHSASSGIFQPTSLTAALFSSWRFGTRCDSTLHFSWELSPVFPGWMSHGLKLTTVQRQWQLPFENTSRLQINGLQELSEWSLGQSAGSWFHSANSCRNVLHFRQKLLFSGANGTGTLHGASRTRRCPAVSSSSSVFWWARVMSILSKYSRCICTDTVVQVITKPKWTKLI